MSLPSITVQNAQRKLCVDVKELQRFAERALPLCLCEPCRTKGELRALDQVAVVLVSDQRIATLHKQFMKIHGPTDVITFQHGEIVVSVETAQRQAEQFGNSTDDEIKLYIVHGLLHLLGFDDTTAAAARKMASLQTRIAARAQGV